MRPIPRKVLLDCNLNSSTLQWHNLTPLSIVYSKCVQTLAQGVDAGLHAALGKESLHLQRVCWRLERLHRPPLFVYESVYNLIWIHSFIQVLSLNTFIYLYVNLFTFYSSTHSVKGIMWPSYQKVSTPLLYRKKHNCWKQTLFYDVAKYTTYCYSKAMILCIFAWEYALLNTTCV